MGNSSLPVCMVRVVCVLCAEYTPQYTPLPPQNTPSPPPNILPPLPFPLPLALHSLCTHHTSMPNICDRGKAVTNPMPRNCAAICAMCRTCPRWTSDCQGKDNHSEGVRMQKLYGCTLSRTSLRRSLVWSGTSCSTDLKTGTRISGGKASHGRDSNWTGLTIVFAK